MEIVALYSTWPDEQAAHHAARTLIEEKLAACANIWTCSSLYVWDNAVHSAPETIMLMKTSAATAAAARDRVIALHPYKTPCVTAWPIAPELSHAAYLEWVANATVPPHPLSPSCHRG